MARKNVPALAWISALALLGVPSCSTNTKGDDSSPVYFEVSHTGSGIMSVNSGTVLTIPTTVVRSRLKSPSATASSFLDAYLESYRVVWTRLDRGTVVPAPEQFLGSGGVVPAGGSLTLTTYPFMSATALERAPFDQLFPFNGGFDRETGSKEIRLRADVSWYGHTLSGQPVLGNSSFEEHFIYVPAGARQVQ